MFTGIITATGTIQDLHTRGNYRVLEIEPSPSWRDLVAGESIAIDGACLTVTRFHGGRFTVEASQETVTRTILRGYQTGTRVNLERAMQVGDRLGGHLVSGHVDTRGQVKSVRQVGESREMTIAFPSEDDALVVEKGSIAINGVSLTINEVGSGYGTVNVIPFTWEQTTVSLLRSGMDVNLEFDLIGKYILRQSAVTARASLTMEKLRSSGW